MTSELTPSSSVDAFTETDAILDSIRTLQSRASAANFVCRIRLPRNRSSAVAAVCREAAVTHVAIDSLLQLPDLSGLPAVSSILVIRPQAHFELNCLEQFNSSASLIWTIDHFAQAETLVTHRPGTSTVVVIRLQKSVAGIGIRAGMDAAQLALGATQLPHVRVQGLLFDSCDSDSALQAAQSTRDRLFESGIGCSDLFVRLPAYSAPPDGSEATQVIVEAVAAVPADSEPTGGCTAEVISRPSLTCAVIAIPEVELVGRSLEFPDLPSTTVMGWCDDSCVIDATGGAARLTIGDVVTVRPENSLN